MQCHCNDNFNAITVLRRETRNYRVQREMLLAAFTCHVVRKNQVVQKYVRYKASTGRLARHCFDDDVNGDRAAVLRC